MFREHADFVFGTAYGITGRREDAEDVVQTAYLQAFRAMSAGERLVNPRAWLMVVVRRQVYNVWRARRETVLADVAEAAVVGSAIVETIERNPGKEAEAVAQFVGQLLAGTSQLSATQGQR